MHGEHAHLVQATIAVMLSVAATVQYVLELCGTGVLHRLTFGCSIADSDLTLTILVT